MKTNRIRCSECALHPLCLPAAVSIDEIERVEAIVLKRRPMQKGDRLYVAGETQKSLFVASEGSFKTVALNEGGEEQAIGFYLPGELLGLDGMATQQFQCDAVALESALVCEVPLNSLQKLSANLPNLQWQLLRNIGKVVNQDQQHLEMMGRKQAAERLAMFLHGMAERQKNLAMSDEVIKLSMSRADIASYLGLVIETVSRTLGQMQDEGLIAVQGREIHLLKKNSMRELAHGEVSAGQLFKRA